MAKVVIIDVDLGINVAEIINESAKDLTNDARNELDNALMIAESARKIKIEKEQTKTKQTTGIVAAMDGAYQKLVDAGESGIPVDIIVTSVKEYIPNSSAFAIRMNNILSTKGNPYRLIRKKVNGAPHYIFSPFNES